MTAIEMTPIEMTPIEDNEDNCHLCDFINTNLLCIEEHDIDSENVIDLINKLKTTEVLECIHSISVDTNVCKYHDLVTALNTFALKAKINYISLYQSAGYYDELSYTIDHVINLLHIFKDVPNVKLVLANECYNIDELNMLRNYFSRQINIRHLQLNGDCALIFNLMELMISNESIETIELDIRLLNTVDPAMVIPVNSKVTKCKFINIICNPHTITEFNTLVKNLTTSCPSISELDFRHVTLNTDTAHIIADIVKTRNITRLAIPGCGIDDDMINILTSALTMSNIVTFDIADNAITHKGAGCIVDLLIFNKSLTDINLRQNPIPYEDVVEIIKALAHNHTVSHFHCSNRSIVTNQPIDSIKQLFEEILFDNYVLLDFYVLFKLVDETRDVGLTLENITNRNQEAMIKSRFAKTKSANNKFKLLVD